MSRAAGDATLYVAHGSGRRQLIAWGVPTLGMVPARFMGAHYALAQPTNVGVVHVYCEGKEVGDARNEIVARSLSFDNDAREVTHVFFLDDDVLPHPEAFKKLYANGRDIVGGLYYLKLATPTPMVLHDETFGVAKSWRPGELVECAAHGMGLTLIRTEVFKRMRDELDLGTDAFGFPQWFKTLKDHMIVGADGRPAFINETEDAYFCKRARSLGYQPCVDTSAQAFGFHWAQKEQRAYPLKQWKEHIEKGTITWETDDGPVVWEVAA